MPAFASSARRARRLAGIFRCVVENVRGAQPGSAARAGISVVLSVGRRAGADADGLGVPSRSAGLTSAATARRLQGASVQRHGGTAARDESRTTAAPGSTSRITRRAGRDTTLMAERCHPLTMGDEPMSAEDEVHKSGSESKPSTATCSGAYCENSVRVGAAHCSSVEAGSSSDVSDGPSVQQVRRYWGFILATIADPTDGGFTPRSCTPR